MPRIGTTLVDDHQAIVRKLSAENRYLMARNDTLTALTAWNSVFKFQADNLNALVDNWKTRYEKLVADDTKSQKPVDPVDPVDDSIDWNAHPLAIVRQVLESHKRRHA